MAFEKKISKQRPAQIYDYNTIKETIERIEDPLTQWLAAVVYGNGCRISEACQVRYCDVVNEGQFLYVHSVVLKKKKAKVTGIQPRPRRQNPLDAELEKWLTTKIWQYVHDYRKHPLDSRQVWPYSVRTARRKLSAIFKCTPHSLRHCRTTHLMRRFNFNLLDLKVFFKLSQMGMMGWAQTYGHLEKTFLEDRFESIRNHQVFYEEPSN